MLTVSAGSGFHMVVLLYRSAESILLAGRWSGHADMVRDSTDVPLTHMGALPMSSLLRPY
jgi:hypothetical protein